jgi:hypothetical protein
MLIRNQAVTGRTGARPQRDPVEERGQRMPLLECPHCYATVMPKASGECPACRGDTRNSAGANPDLCSVMLAERERLPDACMLCGKDTQRRVRIKRNQLPEGTPLLVRVFVAVCSPIYLFFLRRSIRRSVELRVPLCETCGTGTPSPKTIGSYQMEWIVHRDFRRRLQEVRSRTA